MVVDPRALRTNESVSLDQFVRRFIAQPGELERLHELGNPKPPTVQSEPNLHLKDGRLFDQAPITYSTNFSPEFMEHRKLTQDLRDRIREVLSSEDWQATGRDANRFERVPIHPRHWQSLSINLTSWLVSAGAASLTEIEVRRSDEALVDERLREFVLTCLSKLMPGDITKDTLQSLAKALEPYAVTGPMFDRAWEQATELIKAETGANWGRGRRAKNI